MHSTPGPKTPAVEAFQDSQLGDHAHDRLDGRSGALQSIYRPGLGSHWTPEERQDVLQHDGRLHLKETRALDRIRASYKKVTFDQLPVHLAGFDKKQWCRHPQSIQTWERFSFWQCTCTPLVIGNEVQNQLFAPKILPVRRITELRVFQGNVGTAMYRVRLHPCCTALESSDLVFKCFDSRTVDLFKNEARIYERISRKYDPTHSKDVPGLPKPAPLPTPVTRYFGSFVIPTCENWPHRGNKAPGGQYCCETTGKTHVLVLEYAAGGTLTQFCGRNAKLLCSPGWKHGLFFWHQMFNILLGLDVIHGLGITHRDINRSNILYSGKPLIDIEVACFKLVDFGIARSRAQTTDDTAHLQNYPHMAPECIGGPGYEDKLPVPEPFTHSADIWALGCIFSEMLVRFRLGEEGVKEYRQRRRRENQQTPLKDSEWDTGFHDGTKRLSCVDEMHQKALEGCSEDDYLHIVSRLTLKMLQPRERWEKNSAANIRSRWLKDLTRLQRA